jgi:Flp pilus assembly protein TadG
MKAIMSIVKSERGVALIFVAVFLFLFLGFVGIATDAGWIVFIRGQGQARVDAAALAGAQALINQNAGTRQTDAGTLADSFGDRNHIVDATTTTNVDNDIFPMFYDKTTGEATEAADWEPANCNAVKVTNAIPTPLFFSGVRNALGAAETGSTTINVSAVAHLGCPGEAKPTLPITLCDEYITYPTDCQVKSLYQVPSAGDSAFTTFFTSNPNCQQLVNDPSLIPSVGVGDFIRIVNGQIDSCLKRIEELYLGECRLIPVIDCTLGQQLNQDKEVIGFATLCIDEVKSKGSPKYLKGSLNCYQQAGAGAAGECFGTFSQTPVLVREATD